jgi:effector-binding domain-containing protein
MGREVRLGQRDAALVVSKRLPVPLSEIGGVMGTAFGEVYGHLAKLGVASAEPPFVIYHGTPNGDEPFDIEVCAPVARAVDPPPGWRVQELPAGTFVTLLHLGPYDTVGAAYDTVTAWIADHGLVAAGAPREVYLSEPDTPPEQIRTIIELPVTEVAIPAATA